MTRFRTETGSAPSGSEGIREDRERLRADNAALKRQLDVMRALAFRDQLTGLFSRHYLTDYLEQEIERMSGEANIVLALCDIDDFKLINDVRGHQAGDIAIVCIADILDDLPATIRSSDGAARNCCSCCSPRPTTRPCVCATRCVRKWPTIPSATT